MSDPRTLLLATTNAGKVAELRAMLGAEVEVLSLREVSGLAEVPEDGETFEENAKKKAMGYARASGLWALADDSGLCVDALGGRPGVHSARYAEGDDAARVRKLLQELEGVPLERRGARFLCALCLADPSGSTLLERGECEGAISLQPRGENGFGYDPVFWLPALGRTMAELTREEKSRLSHRRRAWDRMKPHLDRLFAPGRE